MPKIREKIFSANTQKSSQEIVTKNPIQTDKINTQAVSLEGYSETAMGVADKVLPSIVGIEIEYKVSSFFGTSTGTATGSGIIISEDRIYFDK